MLHRRQFPPCHHLLELSRSRSVPADHVRTQLPVAPLDTGLQGIYLVSSPFLIWGYSESFVPVPTSFLASAVRLSDCFLEEGAPSPTALQFQERHSGDCLLFAQAFRSSSTSLPVDSSPAFYSILENTDVHPLMMLRNRTNIGAWPLILRPFFRRPLPGAVYMRADAVQVRSGKRSVEVPLEAFWSIASDTARCETRNQKQRIPLQGVRDRQGA